MRAYASSLGWRSGGLALAALIGACAADGGESSGRRTQAAALTCVPAMTRACPCAGTDVAMGMQTCDPTGTSYGPCAGCPPQAGSSMQDVAGAPAQPGAGAGGVPAATDGGVLAGDAAAMPDASEPTLDQGGAVPGTSCGVGLPSLCAGDAEKCCARSLEADTCIAADAACECALAGCTVMEAYCDGPEDCAQGEVCCGTLANNSSGYVSFACATQCASTGNQRIACHVGASQCPTGDICANSQLLTNVQVCIDPATIEQ
jgi:hypothetical protein